MSASDASTSTPNPQVPPQQLLRSTEDDEHLLLTTTQLNTLSQFYVLHELGQGSYSNVYLASTRDRGMRCALKICSKNKILRENKVKQVFREKDVMRLLSTAEAYQPMVVRLFATFHDDSSLYFAMSYAEHKDIGEAMMKHKKFDVETTRFVIAELINAIAYIHSHDVLHRDIKPQNMLVRADYHIMLSDFGCCITKSEMLTKEEEKSKPRRTSFVGSHLYVTPEVLRGESVDESCDYFAVGSILFEFLSGTAPFSDATEHLVFQRICRNRYNFPDDFPDADARDLVKRLLKPKPNERLGSSAMGGDMALRSHSFFSTINWSALTVTPSPLAKYYPKKVETNGTKCGNEADEKRIEEF